MASVAQYSDEAPRRPGDLIVTYKDLSTLGVPHRRKHLRQLVAEGKFPAPVKLGVRAIGWRTSEVHAWVETLPKRTYFKYAKREK